MERNTGGVGKCMEADMIVTSTKKKRKKEKAKADDGTCMGGCEWVL